MDEMTKLVNKKLVIENDQTNSSSESEDNPKTFFNNLWTSSKTNEGTHVHQYLRASFSIRYNTPILSIAAVERILSLEFYFY